MMIRHFGNTRGQAIIFVTLSLVVTFGALGLVVDLGCPRGGRNRGEPLPRLPCLRARGAPDI